MNEIGTLASGVWLSEFDSDTGINTIGSISGWMQQNLGLLNTLIYTDFSGTDPAMGLEESAIYSHIYLGEYYSKQSRAALKGIADDSGGLVEVTEGDTTVRFSNKNEVAKTYRGLARDHKEIIDQMVHSYNMYEAKPTQVAGYEGSTGDFSTY